MRKKPLKNYEGIYEISENGDVFSVKRKNAQGKIVGGNFLKPHDNGHGYLRVILSHDGKVKKEYVHRLVAKQFLENKNNLPCVNHKNGDKKNNNVNNLEWSSYSKNIQHSFKELNRKPTYRGRFGKNHNRSKVYLRYDKKGNFIDKWYSSYEIERELGIAQQNISKVCRGNRKTAGGFIWKYVGVYKNSRGTDKVLVGVTRTK